MLLKEKQQEVKLNNMKIKELQKYIPYKQLKPLGSWQTSKRSASNPLNKSADVVTQQNNYGYPSSTGMHNSMLHSIGQPSRLSSLKQADSVTGGNLSTTVVNQSQPHFHTHDTTLQPWSDSWPPLLRADDSLVIGSIQVDNSDMVQINSSSQPKVEQIKSERPSENSEEGKEEPKQPTMEMTFNEQAREVRWRRARNRLKQNEIKSANQIIKPKIGLK